MLIPHLRSRAVTFAERVINKSEYTFLNGMETVVAGASILIWELNDDLTYMK